MTPRPKSARLIARDENSSMDELMGVVDKYPWDVLHHPCKDLFQLEDPGKYQSLIQRAEACLLSATLESGKTLLWRYATLFYAKKAMSEVPELKAWGGRMGIKKEMHPSYAFEIAELYVQGKASRQALAWAKRFASTFNETHHHRNEKYTKLTDIVTALCGGPCSVIRDDLWKCITKALIALHESGGFDWESIRAKQNQILREIRYPTLTTEFIPEPLRTSGKLLIFKEKIVHELE